MLTFNNHGLHATYTEDGFVWNVFMFKHDGWELGGGRWEEGAVAWLGGGMRQEWWRVHHRFQSAGTRWVPELSTMLLPLHRGWHCPTKHGGLTCRQGLLKAGLGRYLDVGPNVVCIASRIYTAFFLWRTLIIVDEAVENYSCLPLIQFNQMQIKGASYVS